MTTIRVVLLLALLLMPLSARAADGDGVDSEAKSTSLSLTLYVCSEPLQETYTPVSTLSDPPNSLARECKQTQPGKEGEVIDSDPATISFVDTKTEVYDLGKGDVLGTLASPKRALRSYMSNGTLYGLDDGAIHDLTGKTFCSRDLEMLGVGFQVPDGNGPPLGPDAYPSHDPACEPNCCIDTGDCPRFKWARWGSQGGVGSDDGKGWTPGLQTSSGWGCYGEGWPGGSPSCNLQFAPGYTGKWGELTEFYDFQWLGDGPLLFESYWVGHWIEIETCFDHWVSGPNAGKMQTRGRWLRVDGSAGGFFKAMHPNTSMFNELAYSGGGDNHLANLTTPSYDPKADRYYAYAMAVLLDDVDPAFWIGRVDEINPIEATITGPSIKYMGQNVELSFQAKYGGYCQGGYSYWGGLPAVTNFPVSGAPCTVDGAPGLCGSFTVDDTWKRDSYYTGNNFWVECVDPYTLFPEQIAELTRTTNPPPAPSTWDDYTHPATVGTSNVHSITFLDIPPPEGMGVIVNTGPMVALPLGIGGGY